MKSLLFISFAMLFTFAFSAQKSKVLEKSGKTPKWINGIEKEYLIVCGSGTSADAAQENALLKIKERIVSSIAKNISTTNEYFRGDNAVNGVNHVIENFETSTKTKSADISYIKGISLSKAEEYYWEKVSEVGKIRFYYHVKYPFPEIELKKMVLDFEKADFELTTELNSILGKEVNYSSIDEINSDLAALYTLNKIFIDQRKSKTEIGISRLNELLKSVTIVGKETKLGEINFQLTIGDNPVRFSQKPRVNSNCARITDILGNASDWTLKYDCSTCYDNPANSITISYPFGNVKKTFYIDVNADKAELFVKDIINFTAENIQGPVIENAKCHITVISKYESPVVIEKLILNWEKCSPVIVENLNIQVQGKGKHDLNINIPQALEKTKYSASAQSMISGNIFYRSVSGKQSSYELSYQNISTAW